MRARLLFLLAVTLALPAFGDVFSIRSGGRFNGISPVVSIDPATGSARNLFNTNLGPPAPTTFDPVARQFHVVRRTDTELRLNTVSIDTRTVVTRQLTPGENYAYVQWDSVNRRIIGVTRATTINGVPHSAAFAIDPVTAAQQHLVDLPFDGLFALDPAGQKAYLFSNDGTHRLATVDLTAGTVLSVRTVPFTIGLVVWDAATQRLLVVDLFAASHPLVAIEPQTLAVQTLFNTGYDGGAGLTAFDPATRRIYDITSSSHSIIATIDLAAQTAITRSLPPEFFAFPGDGDLYYGLGVGSPAAIPTFGPAARTLLVAALLIAGSLIVRAHETC